MRRVASAGAGVVPRPQSSLLQEGKVNATKVNATSDATATATVHLAARNVPTWDGIYYVLERVGVQNSGVVQPRSPMSPEATASCLTSTMNDGLGGIGLKFMECQDPTVAPSWNNNRDLTLYEAQKFTLEWDGRIRSKITGKCITERDCFGRKVYDLGECSASTVGTFNVRKAAANNIAHMTSANLPVQAIAKDHCDLCGPYMLTYRCRGGGLLPGGRSDCFSRFGVTPGWTRSDNHFLPGENLNRHAEPTDDASAEEANDNAIARLSGENGSPEMLGLESIDNSCGTHVTAGANAGSFWYFVVAERTL